MARHIFSLQCALLLALVGLNVASAQPKPEPPQQQRPDLRPGDKLEVIDMGKLREAEFVEFTPVGLIKVRFEDDSQMAFRPSHVRWAKGVNPRGENPKPAGNTQRPSGPQPATPQQSNDPRIRTWKDASGKFSVLAQFIGLADGKIELRKADGKIISIDLEKLSTADQDAARELAAVTPPANPFELEVADPWAVKKSGPGAWSTELAKFEQKRLVPNEKWLIQPDPAPPSQSAALPAKSFTAAAGSVSGSVKWRGEPNGVIVDPHRQCLWVGTKCQVSPESGRLDRLDLAKGTLVDSAIAPPSIRPMAVDPTGKYLCTVRDDGEKNLEAIVDLWSVTGDKAQIVESFIPYGQSERNFKHVHRTHACVFVDDKHLLTLSGNWGLVLWDIPARRPKWSLEGGEKSITCIALSPNRQQLAVAMDDEGAGVFLLDPLTGKCRGSCDLSHKHGRNFYADNIGFSDDGTRLAAFGMWGFWLWDLNTGKTVLSHRTSYVGDAGDFPLIFGPQGHVIINNEKAYDVRRGLFSCEYGGWDVATGYAGRQWYVTLEDSDSSTFYSVRSAVIPSEEVAQKAAAVKKEDLYLVKDGAKVALKADLMFDAVTNDRVRAEVTNRIKAAGWIPVDAGAEYELILTMEAKNPRIQEIPRLNLQTGERTVESIKVFDVYGKIDLQTVTGARSLWKNDITWQPPPGAFRKLGQTLEEVMRPQPQPEFFLLHELPSQEVVYPKGRSILKYEISATGQETQQ